MRITLPRWVSLTIKGAGYLEGYGDPSGGPVLLGFVAMGAAAGAKGGLFGCIVGALAMLALLGPLYLIGCYDRAVDWEQWRARLAEEDLKRPGDGN